VSWQPASKLPIWEKALNKGTMGHMIKECFSSLKELLLCLAGTPSIPSYEEFLSQQHSSMGTFLHEAVKVNIFWHQFTAENLMTSVDLFIKSARLFTNFA
jgi:hypothetical protein